MKRVLLILTLIVGIGISAKAQERPGSSAIAVQKQVRFYPNPANVVIHFELQQASSDNQASLLIFNFMGKKVYEQKNIPSKLNVNLDGFYRGIYIFQLRDKNGIILDSGKFQVVK